MAGLYEVKRNRRGGWSAWVDGREISAHDTRAEALAASRSLAGAGAGATTFLERLVDRGSDFDPFGLET